MTVAVLAGDASSVPRSSLLAPRSNSMPADQRRGKLLELVRQHGFAALPDLAKVMRVSESTIRRDLDHLEEIGSAKRTHGGVFYTGPSPNLTHFERRPSDSWEHKRAVAAKAVELIEDGDTLLLDGGSTTYEMARLLVGRPLQIVTNSLPVANLFTSSPYTDLVMVGGYVHSRTGVSLGPYAIDMIGDLNVHRAVLSVAGVSVRGYFNSNLLLVETEQAMMKSADEVIIVADSGKFGRQSLAHLCELAEVQAVVVDDAISDEWRQRVLNAGVQLHLGPQLIKETA